MVYRRETTIINGLRYITGSIFEANDREPDISKYEYSYAFTEKLLDDYGNPCWVIDDKDPTKTSRVLMTPTSEQLAAEAKGKDDLAIFTPTIIRDLLKRVEALEAKLK